MSPIGVVNRMARGGSFMALGVAGAFDAEVMGKSVNASEFNFQ